MLEGSGCIVNIKMAHTRYLKVFLERLIKNWPDGVHLLIERVVKDIKIFAVRYKYCKKKTIYFLLQKV